MKKRTVETLVLVLLPAALFVGCAGTGDEKARVESDATSITVQDDLYAINDTAISDERHADGIVYNDHSTELEIQQAPVGMAATNDDMLSEDTNMNTEPQVELLQIIHFDTNKYDLSDSGEEILKQHAKLLLENDNIILKINGHADERGTEAYNTQLSAQRAKQVERMLVSMGVPAAQLLINSFGETQPVNNLKNWDENRRVELEYADTRISQAW